MQIKKQNRRTARRSSRKSHSRKSHSRKAYRKSHSRKAYRSTRRRMGGAHMTVYQPYKDGSFEFDIEINPDIEEMYDRILKHRYNHYTEKMAPTFADQQMGKGDYVVVFNDDEPSATIQLRNQSTQSLEERLKALYDL